MTWFITHAVPVSIIIIIIVIIMGTIAPNLHRP